MPPWAALEWDRTGWTLLMIPTETPCSAAASAARWPARPAPITKTSWSGMRERSYKPALAGASTGVSRTVSAMATATSTAPHAAIPSGRDRSASGARETAILIAAILFADPSHGGRSRNAGVHAPRPDSDHRVARVRGRLRGVPEGRRPLAASAHLPRLRQGRLLRRLPQQAREQAREGGRPPV